MEENKVICEEMLESISAYVDDMLEESEVAALLSHLEHCPACRGFYEECKLISGAFPQGDLPVDFAQKVMSNIQFEGLAVVPPKKKIKYIRQILPVAALFALVFAGLLLRNPELYTPSAPLSPAVQMGEPMVRATLPPTNAASFEVPEAGTEVYGDAFFTEEIGPQAPIEISGGAQELTRPVEMPREDDPIDVLWAMPESDALYWLEVPLMDTFMMEEVLTWPVLREVLLQGGYWYSIDEHGLFIVEDPYNLGSYFYGKIGEDSNFPGERMVLVLGYHLVHHETSRRVELRLVDGLWRSYVAVEEAFSGGFFLEDWVNWRERGRGEVWETLLNFLRFGR